MSKKSRYIGTNRPKHHLKCHLILGAGCRGNILVGRLNDDLKSTFRSMADNPDYKMEVFESDLDHIHFPVRYIPRLSVSQIVRRPGQGSTRRSGPLHHTTLRQWYWCRRLLGSNGFFVCPIGGASPETIRRYILGHGQLLPLSLTSHRAYRHQWVLRSDLYKEACGIPQAFLSSVEPIILPTRILFRGQGWVCIDLYLGYWPNEFKIIIGEGGHPIGTGIRGPEFIGFGRNRPIAKFLRNSADWI